MANPTYGNATVNGENVSSPFNASNLLVGVGIVPRSTESNQNAVPHAYLRLVHYNESNTIVGEEVRPISLLHKNNWLNDLQINFVALHNGRVEVFVVNEGGVDVWFDDLSIVYEQNMIVQENHYYAFGMNMAGVGKVGKPDNKFQYNGKEKVEEFGLGWSDYGARMYSADVPRWWVVDPKADSARRWSPYNYVFNNPIKYTDPNGEFPYPVYIRSFIASATAGGGLFRGDGRMASTNVKGVTSRVIQSYVVDTQNRSVNSQRTRCDFTLAYLYPTFGTSPLPLAPKIAIATPSYNFDAKAFTTYSGGGGAMVFSDYAAQDPLTPSFATPEINVHSTISVSEDEKTGIVSVDAEINGDEFPSTEAFIQDASGKNSVFIGVSMEKGSVLNLFGDNRKELIKTSFQITTDKKGNFTGVVQDGKKYSIEEWNKKIANK